MTIDVNEFLDLQNASSVPGNQKDSIFKSIYIGGVQRQENGVTLLPGHLHVKDFPPLYNQNELYMVILYTKRILVKEKQSPQGRTLLCTSYMQGPPPWQGTAHGPCGRTAAERSADPFCATCKNHLIVAGVLTNKIGSPIKDDEGNLVFGFMRGRGVKYVPISDYVRSLSEMDPPYVIFKDKEDFERSVVNKMKVVTNISPGTIDSKYGPKSIFKLSVGNTVPQEAALRYLRLAKEHLEDFDNKFDWSRNATTSSEIQDDTPPVMSEPPSDGNDELENMDMDFDLNF